MAKRQKISLIIQLFIVVLTFAFLNFKWGKIPPLAHVLHPSRGLWMHGDTHPHPKKEVLQFEGLSAPVTVLWDRYQIPHVQAQNEKDLFTAQGFITARDRLFQMEMQSRVAESTLSELLGDKTLQYDENFLKRGLRKAIRNEVESMLKDPASREAFEAYALGVNTWIRQLNHSTKPLEYKLLNKFPRQWSVHSTASLLKFMTFQLAGYSQDLYLTQLRQRFSDEDLASLFPNFPNNVRPIYYDNQKLALPKAPDVAQKKWDHSFKTHFKEFPEFLVPLPGNGSNNFAVSGEKSATGFPIVENDTHLRYTLPNIWYEIQLTSPQRNVYGASIPGAPSVTIGFNEKISWAVTNHTVDVIDWYELELKVDDNGDVLYRIGDAWKKAKVEYEIIRVDGNFGYKSYEHRLIWTELGPIVAEHQEGDVTYGLAMRWIAHEPANSFLTFNRLNLAQNFAECQAALKFYVAPAQNFICADDHNIGVRPSGKFPLRAKEQGRYVLDGGDPKSHWQGWIAEDAHPNLVNPKIGFLQSANQHPTDETYSYYFNWDYAESFRGIRIHEFLLNQIHIGKKIGSEELRILQNDVLNTQARHILPILLEVLDPSHLSQMQIQLAQELKKWNFYETPESFETTFYHEWWRELEKMIWFDQFGDNEKRLIPNMNRTSRAIEENSTQWLDDVTTPDPEDRMTIVTQSFIRAYQKLESENGPDWMFWSWSKKHITELRHIAQIPGLGNLAPVLNGGSAKTVNANKGQHGAVWRMIVEMGPNRRALVNWPGGQSGNPMSPFYETFVSDWSRGQLREVQFLKPEDYDKGEVQ